MTTDSKGKEFELVFEGPADGSMRTLQKLKGAMVGDLELPVGEVQRFLSAAPLTIFSSTSEAEVEKRYRILQAAGAKVLMIRPAKAVHEEQPEPAALGVDSDEEEQECALSERSIWQEEEKPSQDNLVKPVGEIDALELDLGLAEEKAPLVQSSETAPAESDLEFSLQFENAEVAAPPPNSTSSAVSHPPTEAKVVAPQPVLAAKAPQPSKTLAVTEALFDLAIEDEPGTDSKTGSAPALDQPQTVSDEDLPPESAPLLELGAESVPASAAAQPSAAQLSPSQPELLELGGTSELLSLDSEDPVAPETPRSDAHLSPMTIEPQPLPEDEQRKAASLARPVEPAAAAPRAVQVVAPLGSEQTRTVTELPGEEESLTDDSDSERSGSFLRDWGTPILLLLPVVAAIHYFFIANDEPGPQLQFSLESALAPAAAKQGAARAALPAAEKSRSYRGTFSSPLFSGELTVKLAGTAINNLSFSATTPEPPALTPEEIVSGAVRKPWLFDVKAASAAPLHSEPGMIKVRLPAKLYIDHQETKKRMIGTLAVNGSPTAEDSALTLTVTLYASVAETAEVVELYQGQDGSYNVLLRETLTLAPYTDPAEQKQSAAPDRASPASR